MHPESGQRHAVRQTDIVSNSPAVPAQDVEEHPTFESALPMPSANDKSKEAVTSAEVAAIQNQLSSLKQIILEPSQVLVHRSKSHIVHVGSVSQSANIPVHWRTRCGWSYGLTNLYRLQSMQSGFRGYRKCFRDSDCTIASESDGSNGSSGDEGSTSSSE